ncbi:MAG: PhoH family protein [Clostridia bacterium]|nr:PhoH family protein [Clostridia bacterium]
MIYWIILIVVVIVVLWQYLHQEKLSHNTVVAFVGTMGSGKTFLAVREALAAYRKTKLIHIFCKIFYVPRFFFPTWKRKPVIYSNIPIRVKLFGKNKYSRVLRLEHILRQKLLPEGAIIVLDEIGQFASQWDYENPLVREQLADFVRFYRHWLDGRFFVTDQSSDNIVKAVRCRLGIIYHLNDFHRWLMLTPFFKVDVTPLMMVEDSQKEMDVEIGDRNYFFGILHYRWFQKRFNLYKYNSRCYSEIYRYGAIREPVPFDSTLKTRYLMDLSVSKSDSKDYKDNKKKYREALYSPAGTPTAIDRKEEKS